MCIRDSCLKLYRNYTVWVQKHRFGCKNQGWVQKSRFLVPKKVFWIKRFLQSNGLITNKNLCDQIHDLSQIVFWLKSPSNQNRKNPENDIVFCYKVFPDPKGFSWIKGSFQLNRSMSNTNISESKIFSGNPRQLIMQKANSIFYRNLKDFNT